MSKTVDQRVVEMRFDNAQFERGIAQSMQSLKNLKDSLDFSHISDDGLNGLSKDIGNISTSVDSIADKFSVLGIAGATAIAKISSAAMDLGMSIKDNITKNMEIGYDKYNIMMESIQTIMYGTRDQIGEGLKWATQEDQMDYVTGQIEKLNWYTDETSYNLTDMTNNVGKFVAAGVSLEDATTAMMGISSWAAMSGQNAEAASRAMYNLSQALAIGKVTVADWKSIELANMATSEFKHQVADLAFEMGKLHETEEGWYAAYNDKGKEVLVAYDNIRSSLSTGWFDNEVLTAILKKYGDFADDLYDSVEKTGLTASELLRYAKDYKKALENGEDMTQWIVDLAHKDNIYNYNDLGESLAKLTTEYNELGRQSFMAAQECKTFKDVMLATEDAATSAWMGIYTAIFGNYLQSKELWSSVAEEMYEVLVEGVAAKRNLLQRWNDIGGRDHLVNALWNIWYNIKDVMNAFTEAFGKLFPEKNAVQLLSYAVAFERWTEALRFSSFPWMDDLSNLYDIALNVATAFSHVTNAFKSVGEAAKKAWERIFPKSTTPLGTLESRIIEKILELSEGFEKFMSVLEFTDEQSKKLERTFAGLFAILDIGRMFIATLLEPLTGIKVEIIDIKDPILDVTAAIGDWLVAWRNWIKEHQYFKTLISWIMDFVSKIPDKVDALLKDLFGIGLQDVWKMIQTGAYYAAGAVYMLFTNLPKWANEATQLLFGTDLAGFWEILKGWVSDTFLSVKEFFTGTTEKASEFSKSKVFTTLLSFWEKLKEFVSTTKITIWDFCTGIPGYINLASKLLFKTDLPTFWSNFVGWISDVGDAIVGLFTELIPEKVNELCKYITGSDLHTLWDELKFKITDAGQSIKDFFTDIPNKVDRLKTSFKNSKIYEFWSKFKIAVVTAWEKTKDFFLNLPQYANDLSIKLFGTDIETWWTNLCANVVKAYEATRDFFVNLPDNLNAATQKLFNSDFATFWKTAGENIAGACASVVYFFTHLPEEADRATQTLFKTDFSTWWESVKQWVSDTSKKIEDFFLDLPNKINYAREKLNEFKDTIEKFFSEDIPAKANEWSNKLFGKDVKQVFEDVKQAFTSAKEAFVDFFGIGEEYAEGKNVENYTNFGRKVEEGIQLQKGEFVYKKSGITKIKEALYDVMDTLGPAFKDWDSFAHSDVGKFLNNLGIIGAIAVALYGIYKIFTQIATVVSRVNDIKKITEEGGKSSFWGDFLGGFLNPFKDAAEEAKKATKNIGKIAVFKVLADTILEVAAAITVVAMIDPLRLWPTVIAIGLLFGACFGVLTGIDKMHIGENATGNLMKVAVAMNLLGLVMIEIAAALWIVGQLDYGKIAASATAISIVFGEIIAGLLIVAWNIALVSQLIDPVKIGQAFALIGFAILEVGIAMAAMGELDPAQMIAAAIALSIMLGAMTGALILASKFAFTTEVLIAFGGAMALIGAGAMMAGVGMWLMVDAFENFVSIIQSGGLDDLILGIRAFFDELPHGAEKVGEAIGAFCQSFVDNSDSIKEAALVLADIIMSVIEGVAPRVVSLFVGCLNQLLEEAQGLIPNFMSLLTALLSAILKFISDNINPLTNTFVKVVRALLATIVTLTPEITAAAIALLIDTLDQIANNIGEVTSLLIQILLETIVGTIDGLAVEIPRIMESLWNFVITILNAFADGIEQHTDDLKAALIRVKEAISYFFVEIFGWDPFANTSNEGISSFVDFGSNLISSLSSGMLNMLDDLKEAASKVANAVLDKVCEIFGVSRDDIDPANNSFAKIAMNLIKGLYNKFVPEEVREKIKEWANALLDKVCEVFGLDKDNLISSANNGEFYKIATQLIQGFINAITNVGQQAWSAITGWAQGVIDAAASTFDEHSPSRVFYQIGRYVDEGFANAVEDYAYLSTDATANMAEDSIAAVAGAISSISDVVTDEMGGDPIIKPVLDLTDVTNGAGLINGMFGDQSMNLAMDANSRLVSNESSQTALYNAFEDLKASLNSFNKSKGVVNNNTFNINGSNPKEIADEISRILQTEIERTNAVWE